MTSCTDLEKWHLIETVPWLQSELNHSGKMQGLQRDASWGENGACPLGGRLSEAPAGLTLGWGQVGKVPTAMPLPRGEIRQSKAEFPCPLVAQRVICSFIQLTYLPSLHPSLPSSLHRGSVVSICLQKQHTTAIWPGFGCLLCLFTSAFCPFHFTSSSASTGYSLPAACCISFFPRIYLCVKMHHAGLNNWRTGQQLKIFRMFTVKRGWK